jgi:2-polyprenyl-3-methyl-5-hydroxy-6-metoxy-1,4-benzoquinol methylase
MGDLFDAAAMYDEDYLYFFAAPGDSIEFAAHGPAVPGAGSSGAAAAEMAWRLLDLQPGMNVLDLACGYGDLANRLAARGCRVTGLDSSAVFLDRARADAAASGVSVEYQAGLTRTFRS